MYVTTATPSSYVSPFKKKIIFKSQNLGNKMNEFMNIFIREPTEGVNNFPPNHPAKENHLKLNSFNRKFKLSRKKRDQASNSVAIPRKIFKD